MASCEKCGFPLPEDAEYCPNCGSPVRRIHAPSRTALMPVGRILQAGILGAFISVMISSLTPPRVQLYFIPSFVSSLLVIFLFRTRRFEEAITISFAVYLFSDAILGGIIFGSLYIKGISLSEAFRGYMLTFIDVAAHVFNPVSALIAAYLGNKITLNMIGESGEYERTAEQYASEGAEGPGGVIYSLKRHIHNLIRFKYDLS